MPLNFWLSESCRKIFLTQNFHRKLQNLGMETLVWDNFMVKVEVLSISSVRNLQLSVGFPSEICCVRWQIAISCPAYMFNPKCY